MVIKEFASNVPSIFIAYISKVQEKIVVAIKNESQNVNKRPHREQVQFVSHIFSAVQLILDESSNSNFHKKIAYPEAAIQYMVHY